MPKGGGIIKNVSLYTGQKENSKMLGLGSLISGAMDLKKKMNESKLMKKRDELYAKKKKLKKDWRSKAMIGAFGEKAAEW